MDHCIYTLYITTAVIHQLSEPDKMWPNFIKKSILLKLNVPSKGVWLDSEHEGVTVSDVANPAMRVVGGASSVLKHTQEPNSQTWSEEKGEFETTPIIIIILLGE